MAKKRPSSRHWFQNDDYLWGWYPSSWQGWVVLVAYLLVLLVGSWTLLPHANSRLPIDISQRLIAWVFMIVVGLASLIFIVWKTGGKPHAKR